MKIYVLDFESVLKNYVGYHKSLEAINAKKLEFSDKIESIKNEMERLIKATNSIILDDNTKQLNAQKFKELQQQGMMVESEFRATIGEFQNDELEKNFTEVNNLVNEWITNQKSLQEIDLIVNKNQTIFVKPELDITEYFTEWLKSKNLFQDVEPVNIELDEQN
jgi:Skp family chaperone for outer membrane proteins